MVLCSTETAFGVHIVCSWELMMFYKLWSTLYHQSTFIIIIFFLSLWACIWGLAITDLLENSETFLVTCLPAKEAKLLGQHLGFTWLCLVLQWKKEFIGLQTWEIKGFVWIWEFQFRICLLSPSYCSPWHYSHSQAIFPHIERWCWPSLPATFFESSSISDPVPFSLKPLSHPKTEAHVFNWHCLLTSSYEWGSDQQAAKLIEYPLPSWPWDKEGSELTGTPDWLIAHDPVIKTASCAESLTQWEKIPMGCHGMTLRILGSVSKTKQ